MRRSSVACVGLSCWALAARGDPMPIPVYRFVDPQGVEHFVDQLDEVPAGVRAKKVDLAPVPLNPEVERELERASERARQPDHAQAAKPLVDPKQLLLWSLGMAALCLVLTLVLREARVRSASFAIVFGLLRAAAGALALAGAGFWVYEARDQIGPLAERFPPFAALERARAVRDQVERQQRTSEDEVRKALNER